MKPSFFSVARRPKWIAGLLVAFIVAGTFAALMQWQFSRTVVSVGVDVEQEPVPISELAGPQTLVPGSYDRLVTAVVEIDPANSYIVSDRLQIQGEDQLRGYWVVVNSYEKETGASLTLAIGFASDLAVAQQANLPEGEFEIVGYLEPSEAVSQTSDGTLGSVALSQLVNLYLPEPFESFPAYVIVQDGLEVELDEIRIGIQSERIEINWLTAFYAIEWLLFGLAAFYLWWRLVMDQVARETS
ncbi:MAG: SURF1 family cytochrome oxidase biogenesis protein [Aquiluna sp.]